MYCLFNWTIFEMLALRQVSINIAKIEASGFLRISGMKFALNMMRLMAHYARIVVPMPVDMVMRQPRWE